MLAMNKNKLERRISKLSISKTQQKQELLTHEQRQAYIDVQNVPLGHNLSRSDKKTVDNLRNI